MFLAERMNVVNDDEVLGMLVSLFTMIPEGARTVTIATLKANSPVSRNYVFRFVVLVARFFLQWGHCLASAVVSTRSMRSWSFS